MNVTELELKVQKAQEKVDKTKKTIERHETQLAKKIAIVEKLSGKKVDLKNVDAHKWDENGKSFPYYSEAYDITWKLDDIKGAKSKLSDAEKILHNWRVKLENEQNKSDFLEANTPEVIKVFLEDWKTNAHAYYIKHFEDTKKAYAKLDKKVNDTEIKFVKENPSSFERVLDENGEIKSFYLSANGELRDVRSRLLDDHMKELNLDWKSVQISKKHFAGAVVMKMREFYKEEERLAWLDKTLEADKKAKMLDLITRVNNVVGTITNASDLHIIGGNIEGVVIGTQATARVQTIGAGGYNIQVYHYRTLVTKIK